MTKAEVVNDIARNTGIDRTNILKMIESFM